MNSLLNYWLLFTSLGFTFPFPPCFLSSITCPALTYLPVHLFRAFLTPSTLFFTKAVNLSSKREGCSEEEGGRIERNLRETVAVPILRASICVFDLCLDVLHICFCLFVCSHSLAHPPPARLPKLFWFSVQTWPQICMYIKRTCSNSPPLKPDSRI